MASSNSVPLQLTHQSDTASNRSYPALFSGILVAELCPDVINWIEVMAVQRPRDECRVVGFTQQLLHMVSLQSLHTKIVMYDTHYRDRKRHISLDI